MRILLVNYMETTAPGGINKAVRELAKNLSKSIHEVTVLQSNPLDLPEEEMYEGFKIIRISSKFEKHLYGLSYEMYKYLKKHFKELNPDIVHVHGYHTLFSPEIIYSIKKISPETPVVFSPHFDIFSHDKFAGKYLWDPYNKIFGKKFSQYPAITFVASNFEGNNVNKLLEVPKEKIRVIAHGVDYNDVIAREYVDVIDREKKKTRVNLLFVGYLLELKGVQYIIEAVAELVKRYNVEVCLRIVGEGPYEKELRKLAKNLKVDPFIKWEGFVQPSQNEKLMEYYTNSDIFLLLSESENYGIVVSEALSMGTPVIVTKRTALTEFLDEPGCFGVDYPPKPEKVAKLIMDINENDVNIGPFSAKIRNWNEVDTEYLKVYNEVLGVNK